MTEDKKETNLTPSQQQKLKKWEKKIESGEAVKEVRYIMAKYKNAITIKDAKNNLQRIASKVRIKYNHYQKIRQVVIDFGFENDLIVMEATEEKYKITMLELKQNLIKEFNCESYYIRTLVDMAVIAYARYLSFSCLLTRQIVRKEVTPAYTNFLFFLSKEIDRSFRCYITVLETLKQLKQPGLKVNVKTNNVFISQNQQINANQNKQNETNEVK